MIKVKVGLPSGRPLQQYAMMSNLATLYTIIKYSKPGHTPQKESKDANNARNELTTVKATTVKAPLDQDGWSDSNDVSAFDDDSSDDSSYSSNSSSDSSSSNERSVFSSPVTFASDLYVWKNKYAEAAKNEKYAEEGNVKLFYLFLN